MAKDVSNEHGLSIGYVKSKLSTVQVNVIDFLAKDVTVPGHPSPVSIHLTLFETPKEFLVNSTSVN